jgi:hypothetical protein
MPPAAAIPKLDLFGASTEPPHQELLVVDLSGSAETDPSIVGL